MSRIILHIYNTHCGSRQAALASFLYITFYHDFTKLICGFDADLTRNYRHKWELRLWHSSTPGYDSISLTFSLCHSEWWKLADKEFDKKNGEKQSENQAEKIYFEVLNRLLFM